MSTHYISFHQEIRKKKYFSVENKNALFGAMKKAQLKMAPIKSSKNM